MSKNTDQHGVVEKADLTVTSHARLRWTQRTHLEQLPLRYAWEESAVITRLGTLDADEARYHDGTDTVIVRQGYSLTTVLRADWLDHEAAEAIAHLREDDA